MSQQRLRDEKEQLRVILLPLAAIVLVQVVLWLMTRPPMTGRLAVLLGLGAVATLALAAVTARRAGDVVRRAAAAEEAHRERLAQVEQLQTHNAMLDIVARSVDVPLAFQALAGRIARLVPCDRVGLALLTETGQEFETFTARVHAEDRRNRPRTDLVFKVDGTLIGTVVRTTEPMVVDDMAAAAGQFLDANVLHTAGFKSAMVLPLMSRGRGVGTLNVVARAGNAFSPAYAEKLRPIAEILGVAHVAQQLQMMLGKYRTTEVMAEVMLSVAAEINSALQTIVGHCDLLERQHADPSLQRDLVTIARQAQRIAQLLEKMRTAAHERLHQVFRTIDGSEIPASPEAYEEQNEVI